MINKLTKKTSKLLFASLAVVLALSIGFLAHFQMFGFLARAEEAKASGEDRGSRSRSLQERRFHSC